MSDPPVVLGVNSSTKKWGIGTPAQFPIPNSSDRHA